VKIVQQPDATPGVEGQKLQLECKATGVPSPNYMWFKNPQEPLPDHTSDTLVLPKLRQEDAGKYCCRAQNGVNVVFSAWVEVKVLKPAVLQPGQSILLTPFCVCVCVRYLSVAVCICCVIGSRPAAEDLIGKLLVE